MNIFLNTRIPSCSEDPIVQLNAAISAVKKTFGNNAIMRLPAKFGANSEFQPATVNTTFFLAAMKLAESWPQNDDNLWGLVNRLKLDKVLFPRNNEDKPTGTMTLSTGLQELREKTRARPNTRHPNKISNISEDAVNQIKTEDFEDGYEPQDFEIYQDVIYNAWVEQFPESAVKPTESQMEIIRKKLSLIHI